MIEERRFFFFGWVDKEEGFDVFVIRGFEPEVSLVANGFGFDCFLLDKISEAFIEGSSALKSSGVPCAHAKEGTTMNRNRKAKERIIAETPDIKARFGVYFSIPNFPFKNEIALMEVTGM